MKIGLLTFHDTNNFGSYLQTIGLYKKIVDLGCNCEIIDYQCESLIKREVPQPYKFSISPKAIIKDILWGRYLRKKYNNLKTFLKNNAQISVPYYKDSIANSKNLYDAFVVGSDIVWGMDIIEGDTTYFLDFVNDKKKTAFSSSVGNPWKNEEKSLLKPLLSDFNYIAVRENESADWVEELTGKRPNVVCDPTMLLTTSEWLEYTSGKYEKDKYVLAYFPTAKSLEDAKRYAKMHHLKCWVINHGLPIKGVTSVKPDCLQDFLALFKNAQFVFTASYHGMLFSVYFNRQFAYYNRAHKSRMNTLASKLSVLDREGTEYDVLKMPEINYLNVNKAVEDYRNYSIDCLKQLLLV